MAIAQHLASLEAAGLLRLAALQPELEYLFRHALVQEAAYASLVKTDRQHLHRVVASTVEQLYVGQSEDGSRATMLARHFDEGGDPARALHYYSQAGEAAFARFANAEAVQHYQRALDLADLPHIALDTPEFISLAHRCGRALELLGRYTEASALYESLEARGRATDDLRLVLAGLARRAINMAVPTPLHNLEEGRALCEQALALARQLDDREAEARVLWGFILLEKFSGRFEVGVAHGEQALAIARELALPELTAYILNDVAFGYLVTGRPKRAFESYAEATTLWRQLGALPMLVDSLVGQLEVLTFLGQTREVPLRFDEVYRLSIQIGSDWGRSYSLYAFCPYLLASGDIDRTLAAMTECLLYAERSGFIVPLVETRCLMAQLHAHLGDFETALSLAEQARALSHERLPAWRRWAYSTLAEVHLLAGNPASARVAVQNAEALSPAGDIGYVRLLSTLADSAVTLAENNPPLALELAERACTFLDDLGVRFLRELALLRKSRALLALGRAEEARACLLEGRAIAEAARARLFLWQILSALADAEEFSGRPLAAEQLRAEARESALFVADHIADPQSRESFLNTAEVKRVTG